MPNLLKKGRGKGKKSISGSPARNMTPSTSTLASTERLDATIEAIDWALQIANVVKDVSEGSPLLAPLKAACLLLIRGLEVLRSKRDSSGWSLLVRSLEHQKDELESFAAELERGDKKCSASLQSTFQSYLESLREVVSEATKPEEPSKRSRLESLKFLRHIRPAVQEQDVILPLRNMLDGAYQEFIGAVICEISAEVEERNILAVQVHEDLRRLEETEQQTPTEEVLPYDYDSPEQLFYGLTVQCCEPGTRIAILEDINRWSEDSSIQEQIYWLKDAAGTGKTTVAATMAKDWQFNKVLAGRFFFTPNSEVASGISQFCTAVAQDMATHLPSLRPTITTLLADSSQLHESFYSQFQRLIVEPFQALNPATPLLLVFDALDNCDPVGRKQLLKYILKDLCRVRHVKVLLTSRPDADIDRMLSYSSLVRTRENQLLDIHDTDFTDIRIYVQRSLFKLTVDEHEQLVGYSGGLFIVAATACRMLRRDRKPAELLIRLLNAKAKDHLDELYLEILQQAMSDASAHETMMKVLQIIIFTFQPVSINTIRAFLPKEVAVSKFVDDLGAVLKDGHPDRPIKVLHPTFREFLAEVDRANGFLVNGLFSHTLIAVGCLSVLDSLEYDILEPRGPSHLLPRNVDIQDLDKRVVVSTTAAIRYASSYWSYHVAASLEIGDVWINTLRFLSTKLLNWLELMSLRGDLRHCVEGLSQLRIKVLHAIREQQSPSIDKSSLALLTQAYRFILQHQPIIQESALQTYSSALSFTPEGSPLLDAYRNQHRSQMPKVVTPQPALWSARDILSGHPRYLRELVFSADSSRLVTRDIDGSLILWDTHSGAIVGHPFKGSAQYRVKSLAFSPDGERLTFGGSSRLHLWNATNGNPQATVDTGHGDIVQVTFSPVHQQIISASKEPRDGRWGAGNKIKFWNTLNGQEVGQALSLEGEVRCFAISPDGSRLVSMSREWQFSFSVIVWSLESFVELSEYKITIAHDDLYVRYSPRGDRFVTWDQDGTLYLREGYTGDHINTMSREEKSFRGVYFSPSGHIMASYYGWENPVILLWDPETGVQTFTLSGHSSTISNISFSQDGLRLASISVDQTVRVWDTATGDSLDTFFKGYTGHASNPVLSPDWSKLVTVSITHQINLYDVNAGTMEGVDAYEDAQLDLAPPHVGFSPNQLVVVCGFGDQRRPTLGMWSLETCAPVGAPMMGHDGGILSVAFSPNAMNVISVSEDGTARIWDASNGEPIGEPIPLFDGRFAKFSPDSKLVICASYGCIEVWDVHTRTSLWRLETPSLGDVAFLPDSSRIIAEFKDQICIWDILAGSTAPPVATSKGAKGQAQRICFSPIDDHLMAIASGQSISIWRLATEITLVAELATKTNRDLQLGISSDGKFLAYGSSIWDISLLPGPPVSLDVLQTSLSPLDWTSFPHSLLTYKDGWIYSGSPPGPLMPIPGDLWFQFRRWDSCGTKVVTWTPNRLPFVVDVAPLLS